MFTEPDGKALKGPRRGRSGCRAVSALPGDVGRAGVRRPRHGSREKRSGGGHMQWVRSRYVLKMTGTGLVNTLAHSKDPRNREERAPG